MQFDNTDKRQNHNLQKRSCFIDLDIQRLQVLDTWATENHISRAEAVRRAVDLLMDKVNKPAGLGFGLWAQGKAVPPERGGLRMQQELRNEWPE